VKVGNTARTDSLDLKGYLARIGYNGPVAPTLETLTGVIASHVRNIAFENIDPLLGIPVPDLGARALEDKLVRRRRGGFCYEQNGLLRYALAEIGFDVKALAARVVWMRPRAMEDEESTLTHQLLAVRIPNEEDAYLADVGFGGQTPPTPLRLITGIEQDTSHEPYRVRNHRNGLALESLVGGTWQPLYLFSGLPQPEIDHEVGCWYASTNPRSAFVVGLSATIVTEGARWNLRGRQLVGHHLSGETERIRFDNAAQVLEALAGRYGIDLSECGDRDALETRVESVLDAPPLR
jgi:arylamine N-acetyltransferase